MKKTILRITFILTLFICFNFSATAQKEKFIHYGGLNYVTNGEGLVTLPLYNPRLVLAELSPMSSIGLTSYTSVFFQASAGTNVTIDNTGSSSGSSTSSEFYMDLPIMLELSLGRHANYEANNRLGLFVGAGPTFLYGAASYNGASASASTFGATGYAGLRFKAFRQSVALRGFYTTVFSDQAEPLFGASLLYGLNRNDEIRGKGTSSSRSGSGGGYRYRRSSPFRSKRWFQRANRRQRTRIPRGDRSWLRSNRLLN